MLTNQIKNPLSQSFLLVMSFALSAFTLQLSADENWAYTYNALGLQETADGPRTDVNDVTTYTYDSAGNKITMTNALGQVTQYLDYDARGNVGRMIDTNGVETLMTYHPRGWLATSTVKHPSNSNLDATTTYDYHPVSGLITQMILPNGAVLNYEYDAARRLKAISNNVGERIDYTLDAEGNQTQEVTSENGNITSVVTRTFDELSRLMDTLGNNGQLTQQAYDLNDNNTATTDGNANTTNQSYDALNRVETITQADNTDIDFLYDGQDRIVGVMDPRGVTTTYTYDAYDNVLTEGSPDRGTLTYTYDNANNRTSQIDARGVNTSYAYDALNRLVKVTFNDDAQHPENMTYSYDDQTNGNFGVGRLTGFSDESGASQLKYNNLGQLIEKSYTIKGQSYTQKWTYDAAGNITSETYPLGRVVEYALDALGRVIDIDTRANASAPLQNVISNVTYQPFGGVKSYDYANGISVDYSYDLDGRVSNISASGAAPIQEKSYSYDFSDNITAIDDVINPSFDQLFALDSLNRLSNDSGDYGIRAYTYDDSSNRTQRSSNFNGTMNLTYENDSNRLIGIWAQGIISSDASGNMTTVAYGGGWTQNYQYNAQGRLSAYWSSNDTSIPRKTYLYNALGQRVYDNDANGTDRDIHYNQTGQYIARYNYWADPTKVRGTNEWIYLAGMPIAQVLNNLNAQGVVTSEQITFIHNDHLLTPRLMTDQTQSIVWRWDGDAFGEGGIDNDPDGDNNKVYMPLRFPGQMAESPSGLYYNYFRDYDPSIGRYIQSDPIGLDGGLNTFGYVQANSLIYFDPMGLAQENSVTAYCKKYGPKACAEAGEGVDSSAMQAAKKGVKQREKKQIDDICKEMKVKNRHDFGDFIEQYKKDNGIPNNDTLPYSKLKELADEYNSGL